MDRELVVVFSLLKRARNEKKANKKKSFYRIQRKRQELYQLNFVLYCV